jgi:gamma-glutamyl phosphate reductase
MCAGDVQEILQCRQYDHIHYIIRSKNDRKILDKDFRIRAYLDTITPYGEYELKYLISKETGIPHYCPYNHICCVEYACSVMK